MLAWRKLVTITGIVQEISADFGGYPAKMGKTAKASTVVHLDILIDFGYGAHLRYLCLALLQQCGVETRKFSGGHHI